MWLRWQVTKKQSKIVTVRKNKILDINVAASFSLNRSLKVAPIKNEGCKDLPHNRCAERLYLSSSPKWETKKKSIDPRLHGNDNIDNSNVPNKQS